MERDNGGPAFPVNEVCDHNGDIVSYAAPGMTLRDYFAARAMAALMPIYREAQDEYADAAQLLKCQAESAYDYADAMLAARSK